jgi:short-subunit dehydrogenase
LYDKVAGNNKIDFVFNCAGKLAAGEFQDFGLDLWEEQINVNLYGVIYSSKFAYKYMFEQKSGHIINISSLLGLIPFPVASAYCATKHAVTGLTNSLRHEAHAYGIKVSLVCPGVIKTPLWDNMVLAGNADKDMTVRAMLKRGVIGADKCAWKIIKGVSKNKKIILIKQSDKLFYRLYRIFPYLITLANRYIFRYFRKNLKK